VKTSSVSCGFPNTKRFQQVIYWQTNLTVDFWNGSFSVYGSPGNYFGFYRRGETETEALFWPQIARTLELDFDSETTYKGVQVYRYTFPESVVANSTKIPANAQFYQNGPSGLFNATPILSVPIFYSWPHFYQGDDILREYVDGIRAPDETLDSSFIEINPIIGANCHSSRKIQGNLHFGNLTDNTSTLINIPDLYFFPTYWIDITTDLPDKTANDMKTNLEFYDTAKVTSAAVLITCSILSPIFFGLAVLVLWRRRQYWKPSGDGQLLTFGEGDQRPTDEISIGYDQNKQNTYGTR